MKSLQKVYGRGAAMTVTRLRVARLRVARLRVAMVRVARLRVAMLRVAILLSGLLVGAEGYAQTADGNAGLTQANTLVKSYFTAASTLLYAVGAIIGLIGSIQVYSLFVRHDPRLMGAIFSWFGGCIFLVVVAAVIQSFFGL